MRRVATVFRNGVARFALVCTVVLASSLVATVSWSQQPSITWLGTLPDSHNSIAYGVSADGSVVVGWAADNRGRIRAFRWTAETGMQDLGTLRGLPYSGSKAYGVSADGSVVVGSSDGRAFRWTAETGMQDLGTLPGYSGGVAYGVSADGSVVVGWAIDDHGRTRAFRWTATEGMQDLGTLGDRYIEAYGVSADGSVVVGTTINFATFRLRAFRWTAETGMQDLGTLLGSSHSEARGVSADGSVVVGSFNGRAFRWTATEGIQDLGELPNRHGGKAYAVSADGSVVVGVATTATWWPTRCAFRWTPQTGMEDLNITYASLLDRHTHLEGAFAVSPDGRYIAGWGYNPATQRYEAFLLDTGFPRREDINHSGCVDDADLLHVLLAFGERGYCNEDVNWDGRIDDADLLQVLFNFGSGC